MDGHTRDLISSDFDLACVNPGAHIDVEGFQAVSDGEGALDGATRAIEGGEETVSGVGHLAAAEALELAADGLVVAVDEVAVSEIEESALDLVEGAVTVDPGCECHDALLCEHAAGRTACASPTGTASHRPDSALPRALEQREVAPRLMNGWRFALHPKLFQVLDFGLPVKLRSDDSTSSSDVGQAPCSWSRRDESMHLV